MSLAGRPSAREKKGRTLFVLPTIPDDLPVEAKNGLAIRNACATTGICPVCGTTGEVTADAHIPGVFHMTFRHENDCPAFRDPDS